MAANPHDLRNALSEFSLPKPRLCKDCSFYQAGATEGADRCLHKHSEQREGGVRTPETINHYSCRAMRAGICVEGRIFEAAQPESAAA